MVLTNKIITGHALEILKNLPECSVNMCITSPPYWGLRDYKTNPVKWSDDWEGELGSEHDVNAYVNHLCDVFDEVKKVLKDDGTCWVNIGDTYHKKSLCLIPFKFALEMKKRNWIIRNVIIWHKPNAVPLSVKDRFTVNFEYIFFFSKNPKYYFEQQFEPFQQSTFKIKFSNKPSEGRAEFFQGLGKKNKFLFQQKLLNNELCGRNMRCIWDISVGSNFKGNHIATFPKKLVETPIKAGCPEGGIVLDPFIGSGTTAVVAEKLNRNWLGIELNPEYTKLAEERIKKGT